MAASLVSIIGASTASRPSMPARANARVAGQPPSTSPLAIASTSWVSASAAPEAKSHERSTSRRPSETSSRASTNSLGPWFVVGSTPSPSLVAKCRTTVSPPARSVWAAGALQAVMPPASRHPMATVTPAAGPREVVFFGLSMLIASFPPS